MRFRSTVLALSVAVFASSCASDGSSGGLLITNEQEAELGLGVDMEIEKEFKILDTTDPLHEWANQLVAKLADGAKGFRDPAEFGGYKVEVIADDKLVNAFAAPGGYTYITTGLILQAQSCGAIAGVLGHELGHVTERHGVKQMEKAIIAQGLLDIFLKDGLAKEVATVAASIVLSTKFSQEAEKESDSVGLQVAYNAGYNPYGLVDFFQVLLAEEAKQGGSPPAFLSSHPTTQSRISAITAEIEAKYGDKVNPKVTQTYECVGTTLTLAAAQQRIKDQQLTVKAGTGLAPKKREQP